MFFGRNKNPYEKIILLEAGMGLQGVVLVYATPHRCMPGLKSIRFDEFYEISFVSAIFQKSQKYFRDLGIIAIYEFCDQKKSCRERPTI